MGELIYNKKTNEALYKTDSGWKPSKIIQNKTTGERMAFDGETWKPIGDPIPNDYGFSDEVFNAATFGLSNRLKAAGETAAQIPFDLYKGRDLNISDSYGKKLSGIHGERDRYLKKYPYRSMGAGVFGGSTNPLANILGKWMVGGKLAGSGLNAPTIGGKFLKTVPKRPSKNWGLDELPKQSLGRTMKRGSIGGAGMAGLQGFNEADGEFLDRLSKGLDSAKLGAALGAGAPAVVKGVSTGYRKVADAATRWGGNKRQHTMALRLVAKALDDDGLNPEQALRKIRELGPEGALLDAGEASRRLAYSVYARPSRGGKDISGFLTARQLGKREGGKKVSGQVVRTHDKIDDLGYGGYHDRSDLAKIQKEASELYDKAYANNQVINDKQLNSLLERDVVQEAMVKARRSMNARGELLSKVNPKLTALGKEQGIVTGKGVGEGLKLKYLDKVKRALWDMEEAERDSITGRLSDYGNAIKDARRELTSSLDRVDSTGFYAQARAKAGDKLSNETARRSGVRFMLKGEFDDATTMAKEVADMNPHELHNFRMGVIQSLKRKLDEVGEVGNAVKHLLGKKNLEDRLEVAFGDTDIFERYVSGLEAEDVMYKAFAKMGGSQTATNEASKEASRIDPNRLAQAFSDLGAQRWLRGLYNLVGGVKDRALMPPGTANELGPILTGKNITGLTDMYKAQELSRKLQNALSRSAIQGGSPLVGRQERKKTVLSK